MKFRAYHNNITIRLNEDELKQFEAEKKLKEEIVFGNSEPIFTYIIKSVNTDQISAEYLDHQITIYLPSKQVNEWLQKGEIGIEGLHEWEDGHLSIVVEKDLKRKKERS